MAKLKRQLVGTGLLGLLLAMGVGGCATWRGGGVSMEVSPKGGAGERGGPGGEPRVLEVKGLDGATLDALAALDAEKLQGILQVWVAGAPKGSPGLLGDVKRRGNMLVFVPRYAFQEGLTYRVRFDAGALGKGTSSMETAFTIPAPSMKPVVTVAAIYPSRDELPENLLKFYIHFSGPMSRGDAYKHVHLVDEAGKGVPYPFLELGEELWNPEMTRFTLFFDPGRIKQGLVPRMEAGPALVAGKTYSLVVDGDWKDDGGRRLVAGAKKTFRAVPVDSVQPSPARWRVAPPAAGSLRPLIVDFDEAMDQAMLLRVLTVRDAGGREVAGKVSISEKERRWSFVPEKPWQAGRHAVMVETILEDNAGNSIGRAFEVDLNQSAEPAGQAVVEVAFEVK